MYNPGVLDPLREDHRLIVAFFRALEDYAHRLELGSASADGATAALAFIDHFVEGVHHRREEQGLFGYLREIGLTSDREGGHLTHCHDEARDQVEGMRLAAPPSDGEKRTLFAWNAKAWVALLREHLVMEESWLYPRIEERLTTAQSAELARRLDSLEASAEHQRGRSLIEELRAGGAREFTSYAD